jgi:hypothetical protein
LRVVLSGKVISAATGETWSSSFSTFRGSAATAAAHRAQAGISSASSLFALMGIFLRGGVGAGPGAFLSGRRSRLPPNATAVRIRYKEKMRSRGEARKRARESSRESILD